MPSSISVTNIDIASRFKWAVVNEDGRTWTSLKLFLQLETNFQSAISDSGNLHFWEKLDCLFRKSFLWVQIYCLIPCISHSLFQALQWLSISCQLQTHIHPSIFEKYHRQTASQNRGDQMFCLKKLAVDGQWIVPRERKMWTSNSSVERTYTWNHFRFDKSQKS